MSDEGFIYRRGRWEVDSGLRELRADGDSIPIGRRTFEILETLVQSAPRLVTKNELMNRVWPGGVVSENTIQVHISSIRKALGKERDLVRTSSGRGYRLLGEWTVVSNGPSEAHVSSGIRSAASNNLPNPGSDLIGRGSALEDLRDLLAAHRLITLTGPGGIGKTRLAIDAARDRLRHFHGQCCFVELAPLADQALISSTLATALSLPRGAETSPTAVADAIGSRPFLIVVDNCEHIIDAAAQLAETIIRACPRTTILATSRELLRIEGELVYLVPPLSVPPIEMQVSPSIASHGAVELFVARLVAQRARRTINKADLATIGRICRQLDGIPLAIELAAAQAANLSLAYVADRLTDIFSLLVRGNRTLPRHQTLRATLDWSFGLLSAAEQSCLCRLAVFAGGFTLDAAAAVVGDAEITDQMITDLTVDLVAKSLVTLDEMDAVPRWRLLETTRAYAREKLIESGQDQNMARRHALYFRDVCNASPAEAPDVLQPLSLYRCEIDNIRAALDWAFSPRGEAAIGIALTVAAIPGWCQLSLLMECRTRVEQALKSPEVGALNPRLRLELVEALGFAMTNSTALPLETIAVLDSALELARGLGDVDHQLRALWSVWTCRFNKGANRASHAIASEFVSLATEAGQDAELLVGKRLLGTTLHYMGNQAAARTFLQTTVEFYRPTYHERHRIRFQFDQLALGRAVLARVLWLQGFADQALRLTQQNIDYAVEVGHAISTCYALAEGACPVALLARDLDSADRYVRILIETATRHDLPFWAGWGRCLQAELLVQRGDAISGSEALIAAIRAFRESEWGTRLPELLGASAQALGRAGRPSEGTVTIDEALALQGAEGYRWCAAELIRIKGELLLQIDPDDGAPQAEQLFHESLNIARQQGALALELRAALSLARIGQLRGNATAMVPLSCVYSRFTEGFQTGDLQEAETWLAASRRRERAF